MLSTCLCICSGALLIGGLIGGCSAGQPIRVLRPNETQLTASLGGPVVPSSSPVKIIPYVTVGIMHGVTEEVTLHGNLHALLLAFGTAGIDVGASGRIVRQDGALPEMTIGLRTILFTDFSSIANSRIYPNASIIASWEIQKAWLVYAGTHATVQLSDARVFVSPMIGTQVPASERIFVQAEFIWQAANVVTTSGLFRGESSIGGQGSIGMFVGVGLKL